MPTKIEYCDETWSPVTGCTPISEGCKNCWAKRMARRLAGRYGYPEYPNHFDVTLHQKRTMQASRWRKPRRIFVCSMSDLFHKNIPFEFIDNVYSEMLIANQHTYMLLTKRPQRALEYFDYDTKRRGVRLWKPPHIWIGVTAENQKRADERIPILLQIPAAVRFVSIEPMLGPIDFQGHLGDQFILSSTECWKERGIDWVIVGGETGPGARHMHPDWARSVRDQCKEASVPFFFKNWGHYLPREEYERRIGYPGLPNPCSVLSIGFLENNQTYYGVGPKRAGRLLDGVEYNEYPGG